MYKGVANSPDTFLTSALAIGGTTMYVADSAVFGELPNLAVLGSGTNAETVLIKSKKPDGGLEIERGIETPEKKWEKATVVARNFTNYDYEQIRVNIENLDNNKADKIDGKGLSTNDYDNIAKSKVDGIPSNPKYTDTIPDLSSYAKTTDVKTKLSELEQDTNHRTLNDTEKAKVQAIPSNPKYTDTVPDLSLYAKKTEVDTELSKFKEQVILTEAEYNALSSAQQNDETKIYFIKA